MFLLWYLVKRNFLVRSITSKTPLALIQTFKHHNLVGFVPGWIGSWFHWISPWLNWSLVGFVLGWIGPWFEWSLVEMVLGLISPWLDQSCIGSIFVMTVKDSHLHQFTNMTLVYIFQVLEVLSSGLCRDNVRN